LDNNDDPEKNNTHQKIFIQLSMDNIIAQPEEKFQGMTPFTVMGSK
jgi:hypothetical protein